MVSNVALLATVILLQGAVDLSRPVFGAGYVVTLTARSGPAAQPVFVFSIQRAGLPEDVRELRVEGLTTIQHVSIYPGPVVAVLGQAHTGHLEGVLLDGRTGDLVFRKECANFAYDEQRQVIACGAEGQLRWTYSPSTGDTARVYGAVPGVLRILSSGSLDARRKMLPSILDTAVLWESVEVRRAIGGELHRVVAEDRAEAARNARPDRLRRDSPTRDYLGELITTVAKLRMAETLPVLVEADHYSTTAALMTFRGDSIPWVLEALGRPAPSGYSDRYRAELVYALARILQGGVVPDNGLRGRIAAMLQTVLSKPDSPRELIHGFLVLLEIDDESFDPVLRKWIANPAVAGGSPREIEQIQKLATRVLESRVVIR